MRTKTTRRFKSEVAESVSSTVRNASQILGDVNALQQVVSDSIADCERRVKEANDELHALYVAREGLAHALGRDVPAGSVARATR